MITPAPATAARAQPPNGPESSQKEHPAAPTNLLPSWVRTSDRLCSASNGLQLEIANQPTVRHVELYMLPLLMIFYRSGAQKPGPLKAGDLITPSPFIQGSVHRCVFMNENSRADSPTPSTSSSATTMVSSMLTPLRTGVCHGSLIGPSCGSSWPACRRGSCPGGVPARQQMVLSSDATSSSGDGCKAVNGPQILGLSQQC